MKRIVRYFKWLFRPKWIWLKIPTEYKSQKERTKCLTTTEKHILDNTKIIY
jgi:hypothetical protein